MCYVEKKTLMSFCFIKESFIQFFVGFLFSVFVLVFIYTILWSSPAIRRLLPLLTSACPACNYLLREDFVLSWAAAETMQTSYERGGPVQICACL